MKQTLFIYLFFGLSLVKGQAPADWSVNASNYEHFMTFTAVLKVNITEVKNQSNVVAAFHNGEVRGISKTEIINEEPNFDEPVVQTKEDQFFGKQTEIDRTIPDDLEVTIVDDTPVEDQGKKPRAEDTPVEVDDDVVDKEIEIGLIYAPCTDELFAAQRGSGATLNGRPMQPSEATSLSEGIVGLGYSPKSSSVSTKQRKPFVVTESESQSISEKPVKQEAKINKGPDMRNDSTQRKWCAMCTFWTGKREFIDAGRKTFKYEEGSAKCSGARRGVNMNARTAGLPCFQKWG